jgi:hypothetical protein
LRTHWILSGFIGSFAHGLQSNDCAFLGQTRRSVSVELALLQK